MKNRESSVINFRHKPSNEKTMMILIFPVLGNTLKQAVTDIKTVSYRSEVRHQVIRRVE